jgi:AcrR family transcriptional regulator
MSAGGRPRRRRSKVDYLDAALALADRRAQVGPAPYAYAVAHVDMAQVAEAAGVSRSALYRLWDTQDAFRADLAAHLAATDDAPWLAVDAERLGSASVPPDAFRELTRRLLAEGQDQLAADAQPLLRAGFAGYPNAREVTGVVGEREGWRLLGHAELVERALAAAGRRCVDGVRPLDLAVATACVAEGLALAAHMTPPDQQLAVGCDPARPWSLLAVAACLLFEGLSEPDPGADRRGGAARPPPGGGPPHRPRPARRCRPAPRRSSRPGAAGTTWTWPPAWRGGGRARIRAAPVPAPVPRGPAPTGRRAPASATSASTGWPGPRA